MNKIIVWLMSCLIMPFFLGACSSVPAKKQADAETNGHVQTASKRSVSAVNEQDPWEDFNRGVHGVNTGIDNAVLKPLAKGYQAVTPEIVDKGISNFFGNLGDVGNMINNALQFKGEEAISDMARVIFNSTFGLAGFLDVASEMGIPKHDEDFGQTLASWGVESGPYLELPLLGPSTLRDAPGRIVDFALNPVSYLNYSEPLSAVSLVDTRADLLDTEKVLKSVSSVDRYATVRDAWLQRREFLVNDGKSEKLEQEKDDLINELEALE